MSTEKIGGYTREQLQEMARDALAGSKIEIARRREARSRRYRALGTLTFYLVSLAAIVGLWALLSWREAKAYETVTGHRVSVVDAMFLDLRVQAPPR